MNETLPQTHRSETLDFLIALADDDYLTGHRLGMWLAVSPTLEEDNALTSIAQDELGHARLWYNIVVQERSTTTDALAIERGPENRRNSILVEREYADFADAVVRNWLYDTAEQLLLESIRDGEVDILADTATVALNEEPYHREHANKWLEVLTATEESRDRLERAVRTNCSAAADLFAFEESLASGLLEAGVLDRSFESLSADFETQVTSTLAELPIEYDVTPIVHTTGSTPETNGRLGEHTADLSTLHERMQPKPIEQI